MRRAPYIAAGCVSGAAAAFLTPDSLIAREQLPSEYRACSPEEYRYEFNSDALGLHHTSQSTTVCTPLQLDESTQKWDGANDLSAIHLIKATALRFVYGLQHYEVSGMLDAPKTHLLSTKQWSEVLGISGSARGRALDVGAGCGFITAAVAPLFEKMYATEVYDVLRPRLASRGFVAAITTDPANTEALKKAGLPTSNFDCVLALNVLDRVPRAETFLRSLISLLAPDGKLVLSIPLPHKHINTEYAEQQREDDALPFPGETWEAAAGNVCRYLEGSGLRVVRVARAPYLSQGMSVLGTEKRPFVLDAAIIVCVRDPTGKTKTSGGLRGEGGARQGEARSSWLQNR